MIPCDLSVIFAPSFRQAAPGDLARLDLDAPIDWDGVHGAIQSWLAKLDSAVRERAPEVRGGPGRSSGLAFPLYSYWRFELESEDDADAVIAGIDCDFESSGATVLLRADIGGESTGRIDFELPPVSVPARQADVEKEASRLAAHLSSQAELVVRRVEDRFPLPEYR